MAANFGETFDIQFNGSVERRATMGICEERDITPTTCKVDPNGSPYVKKHGFGVTPLRQIVQEVDSKG
jgi:hypothetical protein